MQFVGPSKLVDIEYVVLALVAALLVTIIRVRRRGVENTERETLGWVCIRSTTGQAAMEPVEPRMQTVTAVAVQSAIATTSDTTRVLDIGQVVSVLEEADTEGISPRTRN